jgi:hypothetical protein
MLRAWRSLEIPGDLRARLKGDRWTRWLCSALWTAWILENPPFRASCAVYKVDDHALVSGWSAEGNSASVTQYPSFRNACASFFARRCLACGFASGPGSRQLSPSCRIFPDQPGQSMGDYPKAPKVFQFGQESAEYVLKRAALFFSTAAGAASAKSRRT